MKTPYTQLLTALKKAQQANASAKSTAANGVHFDDYEDGSRYARANYKRSRAARDKRYADKEKWLCVAVPLAAASGVVCGHADGVLYFNLPTGQVSFHSDSHGAPAYPEAWDEIEGAAMRRIEAAIESLKDGGEPTNKQECYEAAKSKTAEWLAKQTFFICAVARPHWTGKRQLLTPRDTKVVVVYGHTFGLPEGNDFEECLEHAKIFESANEVEADLKRQREGAWQGMAINCTVIQCRKRRGKVTYKVVSTLAD